MKERWIIAIAFVIIASMLFVANSFAEEMVGITIGSYITFGRYEQDNNQNNGTEPIEWLVLDVQDNEALIISKFGLDARSYNTRFTEITWETCTLREWLNHDFLNEAFSAEEQAAILLTDVDNSQLQGFDKWKWKSTGGNDTQDRLFLLSYDEAFNRYFMSPNDRMCAPTEYAIARNAFTSNKYQIDGKPTTLWWLRSPGSTQDNACDVNDDGNGYNNYVDFDFVTVRPALWVNLDAIPMTEPEPVNETFSLFDWFF